MSKFVNFSHSPLPRPIPGGLSSRPSPRTVRIAVLGDSPCERCAAHCCKQRGHDFAAILAEPEWRRFAAFSVEITVHGQNGPVRERVLPYVNGRCQFLGMDDRCTIYEDRPRACRVFQCVHEFNARGIGDHGEFLVRNPEVLGLLESL